MIRKTKSIEQLYEETKIFDLVITNDAPLNTALNKMINKPMLGSFALTSKLIGSKYTDYLFEEEQLQLPQLVLKIKNELKLNLKEALFYTKNIIKIWQHIGELEKVKKYVSNKEKLIINYLKTKPTYHLSMQNLNLEFLNKSNIAVIGKELFNSIDKKVITQPTTSISFFKEEKHKLESIYLFNSQKDIIDRVSSIITKDNQNSIAIVLNIESDYLPLIKARLINNNIQLNEKLYLSSDFRVRELLSIIDSSISMHNIKTKKLIPIANILNINLDHSKEDALFKELIKIDKNAKQFSKKLKEITSKTYLNLIKELKQYKLQIPYEFIEILHTLDIHNKKIDYNNFLELKYFLENFEQEFETNKSGVLLIDAKNSTYINRDIIFYIGMDYTWTKIVDDASYLDIEEEMQKNIKSFEILIQQGKERFFFVPQYTNSDKTIPPYYFNYLTNKRIESYEDSYFKTIRVTNQKNTQTFSKEQILTQVKYDMRETLSNSSLNKLVQCPKGYSYNTLVSGVDKDFFLKGNLIHEFAEFYINQKEFVNKTPIDEFVELMSNEMKLLSNPYQNKIISNQMKFAIQSVIEFINSQIIDDNLNFDTFKEISKKNQENIFAKHFNKEIYKNNAELEFKDTQLKLNGFIDLAINSSLIIDYKTAKTKKKIKSIFQKSNIKELTSDCDFQPLVYLSIFRKVNPNKEIQFWYNFPMINSYQRVLGEDLEETNVKIHYIPQTFKQYFISKEFFEIFCQDTPKYAEVILDLIEDFSYFNDKEITNEMLEMPQEFANEYLEEYSKHLFQLGLKDTKTNIENISKILKSIFDFRIGDRTKQKEIYFFKETLDEFETFVKDKLNELNQYYKSSFPYKPVENYDTCKICDFKSICLKQMEEIK